jgi:S-adenosylmethionine hydrolase
MTLITLLTDFGVQDEYVGVMKGVIAGINPEARIVDISHHIVPQDIVHGAFILAAAYSYFPAGTVHVAIVDPGVGGARRILAVECGEHRFVAPDNGLLERVLAQQSVTAAVSVTDPRFFLEQVSCTFHGRDIFAPVAAHLAFGLPLNELGRSVDRHTMITGVVPRYRFSSASSLEGTVVAVDHFGNLMTNIDAAAINRLTRGADRKNRTGHNKMVIEISGKRIDGIVLSYDRVPEHIPLAIIGSRGLLEISVNCGSARQILNAGRGDGVRVRLF